MGRGRGGHRGRGGFKGKRGGGRSDVRTEPWNDIKRENELYEEYYRKGGFLDESEFEDMWQALASNLPNSFRFTGTKAEAHAVREIFKQRYVPAIKELEFEGQKVEPPEPVSAFPDELVWHMKTDKKIIRRHKPFAEFQKFLVAETTAGNISRQEVVSMIPPHFLDVRPGMVVLDMCAAPGSKSAQLAEMIHGDEEERVQKAASGEAFNTGDGDYSDDGRSTGLLIANDTDYKRAGMLVHQVKRLNFPNLIVTQHDASIFPSIELPPAEGSTKPQYLKFDRVLADVPCSGDGTARKNVNVWQKWTPRDGLGLHGLQLRILQRGIQLLKKGGRIVYSTCSMNPVENEAVVASAIEACGGVSKISLVDVSDHLPNLKRKPGMNTWKVLDTSSINNGEDKMNHMFSSWESFQQTKQKYAAEQPNRQFSNKIVPGVFAPVAASEDQRIPLERCVRVYPHQQDTGGFFIAVLEKKDDIKVAQNASKAESTSATPAPVSAESNGAASPTKRKLEDTEDADAEAQAKRVKTDAAEPAPESTSEPQPAEASEQPITTTTTTTTTEISKPSKLRPGEQPQQKEYFEYLPSDDATVAAVLDFFGISPRFPRDRFLVRNKEGLLLNKMYYTSALAKTILNANKDRGMKFIHCGVVMFVAHKIKNQEAIPAPWRLQNEGIKILEPWASKRIITCDSKDSFYKMLIEMFPKLPKDESHGLGDLGKQLMDLDVGCAFLKIEKDEAKGFPFSMVLPVWRHPGSVNLMVDKDDRKAMLLRLFNEQNPHIINHVVDKAKAEAAAAEAEAEAEEEKEEQVEAEAIEEGKAVVDGEVVGDGDVAEQKVTVEDTEMANVE